MKWRSKVTGNEVEVRDGWNDNMEYWVGISFSNFEDTSKWIRLKYSEFIEVFEKVEDANI